MDVLETDKAYQLAIELPGIPKEAIQVDVYENSVTISAEANAPKQEEGANWLLRERSFGKFSRSIALPEAVDEGSSEARYVDGVLYLTLQKKRASEVKRLTVN
jgi:HSP20 family protein